VVFAQKRDVQDQTGLLTQGSRAKRQASKSTGMRYSSPTPASCSSLRAGARVVGGASSAVCLQPAVSIIPRHFRRYSKANGQWSRCLGLLHDDVYGQRASLLRSCLVPHTACTCLPSIVWGVLWYDRYHVCILHLCFADLLLCLKTLVLPSSNALKSSADVSRRNRRRCSKLNKNIEPLQDLSIVISPSSTTSILLGKRW
jgi:hypothetical protein